MEYQKYSTLLETGATKVMNRTIYGAALCALALVAFAASVHAQDQWSGRTHFGFAQTSSTIDFIALTLENDIKFEGNRLSGEFDASLAVHRSTVEGQLTGSGSDSPPVKETTTTEHYVMSAKGRYALVRSVNVTAKVGWERNSSLGIDARIRGVLGLGREFASDNATVFRVEAVGGAFFERSTALEGKTFAVAGVVAAYHRPVGEHGSFSTEHEFVVNLKDTNDMLLTSRSSVQASLTDRVGIAITHRLIWDNRPSDVVFDPTGTGRLTTSPVRLQSTLTASLAVRWGGS